MKPTVAGIAIAIFWLCAPGGASASGETAEVGLRMEPVNGKLSTTEFRPVHWNVQAKISTPDSTVMPIKQINQTIAPGSLTFNPDPKMPVCGDDQVGEGLTSVPVPTIVARCPNSVIGNGVGIFNLAQSTSNQLEGVSIIFNGGLQKSGPHKGQPRIKVYSYSYDIGVGIYTESTLTKDGKLDTTIPQLPGDSSVTSIELNIPGKPVDVSFPSLDQTITLPAGQDPEYVRARCPKGAWDYSAELLLGNRDSLGDIGPTTRLFETGSEPCLAEDSGTNGKPRFGPLKIRGPGSVKAGRFGVYRVAVKNVGDTSIKAAKVTAGGKGAVGAKSVGTIKVGKTKTVAVRVKFSSKGRVKLKFRAKARGVAARSVVKPVTVG